MEDFIISLFLMEPIELFATITFMFSIFVYSFMLLCPIFDWLVELLRSFLA